MKFNALLALIVIFSTFSLSAQTTYTWIGGNGSWAIAGNWSPTRTTPATTDILQFNDGASVTPTNIPTQTIRQLLITNNTQVVLQANAGSLTLTISGPASSTNLLIEDGSSLGNQAANPMSITLTSNTQLADISGTLDWRGGTLTLQATGANVTTVSSTGVVNHYAGTITAALNRLVFEDNSNYNYLSTGALTIPTATWQTNSNVNITTITSAVTVGGVTGQSFGNFTYNCSSQTTNAVTMAISGITTRIKGDFKLESTGTTGSLSFKNGTGATTINVDGRFNITGGTLNANIGGTAALTLNLNGEYDQTGGTFNLSTAAIGCVLNLGADFNQTGGTFTQSSTTVSTVNFNQSGSRTYSASGTITNTNLNYVVVSPAQLTLNSTLTTSASRTLVINSGATLTLGAGNLASAPATGGLITNSGTLILGPSSVISGSGGFTNTSAANTFLRIGSQDGISTTGATGNIQVGGTRTFGLAANYIYTGTNGQITGNGCPANVTGSITLNLQNISDQLTVTNANAIGAAGTLRIISGSLANAITYNATGRLEYAGIQAQTTTNNEFPATSGPAGLIINNPFGVTLHASRSLPTTTAGILTLTAGVLNTTSTEILSVLQAVEGALVGGDANSYVNGPLIRAINAAGVYRFPVGDGAQYGGYYMTTAAAASGVQLRVQHVNSASGGIAGSGLATIQPYYWSVERTAGTTAVNYKVELEVAGLALDSRVGYSTTQTGAYDNQGGVNIGTSVTAQLSNSINTTDPNAFYTTGASSPLIGVVPIANLTSIAQMLQLQVVTGNTIFELPTTYTGEPTYPVTFQEFNTNGPNYTVTIRPESGSVNILTSGVPASGIPLIDLNGVDRLIFDGRAGGTGPIQWTFRNARTVATFSPTFRFINGAIENQLRYLNIESQNTLSTSGTILFSTSTIALGGNNNNLIEYCEIRENTANSATPTNAIYALGTTGALNLNNMIRHNNIQNFYLSSSSHTGINISTFNNGWQIERNSFYQTVSRTNSNGSFNAISVVNNEDNFVIRHNYIGGSQPLNAGSALTYTGTGSGTFFGIDINPATSATNCIVDSNIVANINFSRGTSTTAVAFVGIRNTSGASLISENLIGSTSANGNITITENFATTPSTSNGIINASGNSTIEKNTISGITLSGASASVGHSFYGVLISGGICTVDNNTIGSNTLANSIYCNIASTNTNIAGQFLNGINYTSTSSGTGHSINNNTIANLTNDVMANISASNIRGISTSSSAIGGFSITGNTIHKLRISGASTTTEANAVAVGILFQRTLAGQNISNNTIHSLEALHPTASNSLIGIHYAGPTLGTNTIGRNNIHSLSVASNNASAVIYGINILSGLAQTHNNMIRLGIDASGTDLNNSISIVGLRHSSTTANNLYYFNTVYIGGSVSSGNVNTFALHRAGGSTAMNVRNNIFMNERSQVSGSGSHYCFGMNVNTAVTSNYNIYKADGQNGNVGFVTSTSHPTLVDFQNTFSSNDVNSLYGPVPFVNATGNAAQVDLHVDAATSSQNESAGVVIAGFDTDIDGDPRGPYPIAGDIEGTAPDIGADEGNFQAADVTPPTIVYTPIPTQPNLVAPALDATITDASGVNITSGTKPRLYFKYSTNANTFAGNTNSNNGWKFVESPSTSSPFTFNIDYSLLFGGVPLGGESIEYFVVAQDLTSPSNVAINNGIFNSDPTSVNLGASQFPLTGSINSYLISVLSGTVTVGTSGTYPSLTNNGGLFEAINSGALSGNLIAEITSDLTGELGTHGLNQWVEIGAGNYTLTIRPDGNTNRLISGNYNGASNLVAGLIRFNGADRVIIDGRNPSDLAANGRHLLFRNISTTNSANNSTFNLLNDADNITIRNIQAEGATTGGGNGVIRVSSEGSGDGNDFVNITECVVRDRSDAAGIPANGIYIVGAFGRENNNYTISNNEVFNYHFAGTTQHAGIYTGAYCTDFTISGNNIYDPVTRNTASYKMGIWVNSSTGTGANFNISNNFIGGNSAGANGTWTVTSSGLDYRFCGIWISCSNTGNSVVSNNTIRNFSITNGSTFQTLSSVFTGIYVAAGDPTISDNSIGGNTGNISITNSIGQFTWVHGIFYNSNGGVNISENSVGGFAISNTTSSANIMNMAGIRATTSSSSAMLISGNTVGGASSPLTNSSGNTYNTTTGILISGILVESAQPTTIENNTVSHISYTANGQSTSGAFQVAGIRRVSAAAVNTITGNTVHNISSNSPYNGSGANVGLAGIYAGGTSNGQNFSENTIHTIRNTNAGAVAVRVYGLFYTGNTGANNSISRNSIHSIFANSSATTAELAGLYVNAGNALVANNMIRIGIDENGNDITRGHSYNGIHDQAGANNYYHNSVYVGGVGVASGAIASHAFFSAVTTGNRAIQNNIFWNGRSNGAATGSHYAIRIGALTNLTISHNLLFANGNGGILGNIGGTDQTVISTFGTGNLATNPIFVNHLADATAVDLHIQEAPAFTPIESVGTPIAAVTVDFDGEIRADSTPADIGADAGLFQAIDNIAPEIGYTPIANACNAVSSYSITGINIEDNGIGSSINIASGTKPRLYYKKTTDANDLTGWKYVEATNAISPFEFNIDYTLLNAGSVNINDQIEYFIIAQDQGPLVFSPNVAINSGSFATSPSSVALTAAAFPIGGSINTFLVLPCQGTVTVGTGGDYPALTTTNGIFQAINNSTLTGDLTIEIISNISIENGAVGLNPFATPHQVEIRSNGTPWTLSGSFGASPNGLFRLNGADRVTVNGGTTTQRLLTFRNTNTTSLNATWHLSNDAQDILFNNLIIEGGASSTLASGVVLIGSGSVTGNDDIQIIRCDIRDLTTTTSYPRNGIYAAGTSASIANNNVTIEDCAIFNFYSSGSQSSGVRIETFNAGWLVKNNDFYQTSTQNATSGTEQYVIYINSVTGQNTIDGNRIGGSNVNLNGNWQISPSPTTPSTYRFVGIWQNSAPTTGHQIINNQIGKLVMQTSSGASTNYGVFSGIYVAAGNSTITNNLIGADNVDATLAANANIDFGSSSNGATFFGIRNIGTGTVLIDNNKIGGIRFSNATGSGTNTGGAVHAISSTAGVVSVTNNTIGSTTTAHSLVINGVNATTNPVNLFGIEITSSNGTTTGNLVQNLTNSGLTSSGLTHGIRITGAGSQAVNNNTIAALRGAGTQSSFASSASVAGIVFNNSSTTTSSVSNNIIYNLVNNVGIAHSAKIIGISFASGTNVNHSINANQIYGFNSIFDGSGIQHVGIELASSSGTVRLTNNMIRLGRIADGNTFTNSSSIVGILDQSNSAQNIWFNTVLIDGTVSGSAAANSYAYYRNVNTGADNIRNNIFANNRTGGPSGSIHFSWASNTLSGFTAEGFDNNIFFSAGNTEFSIAATPVNLSSNVDPNRRLQALRGNAGLPANNLRSGIATLSQINFIDATGVTPNLRLNNANCAAAAGANITGMTTDFDGTISRANPPAIGAHESTTFNPINATYDIFTPVISVSSVPTVSICSPTQIIPITATITDVGTGINTSTNPPNLWWRRSAPSATAWTSVTPTSSSGNANNGSHTFEISISPAIGETYQYYVVSEDEATSVNRWFSHFGANDPVHASVSIQTTAAANPASFNTVSQTPLSGTVTVGTGGTYPRFNGTGGLFEAINNIGLSSDLEVLVVSNVSELANWTPLFAHQEYCGSGFTITVKPNSATLYTIETNTSAANAMFSFLGARRIVFDGSYDGSGRYLLLRHNKSTSIYPSTIEINNSANNISFNNCIIEGANINSGTNVNNSCGVIKIGGPMGFASGNINNLTFSGNLIRNLSNVSPTLSNIPQVLIYMGGASSGANINNINITGNDFTNFQGSAVRADNGSSTFSNSIGNNISITNNNIYQELIIPTYQYPIVIDALGNTYGHVISGNKIGGSSKPNPEISGTWQNNKTDGEVIAVYANVGNAPTQEEALSIQGNKIQNINISGTGWTNFIGIRVQNGRVNIGNEIGNVIGSEDNSLDNIISNGSGGSFITEDAAVMGIWTQTGNEVVIENNIISGLSTGLGTFCYFDGIAHGSNLTFNGTFFSAPGGKATIKNNTIANNRSSSNLQSSASNEGMISLFVHTNSMENIIEGNLIINNALNATANANVRNHGVMLGILGQSQNHGGIFRNNIIAALANANFGASGNVAPEINGLILNYGDWEVSNNMISLRNGTTGSHLTDRNTILVGIRDHLRNLTGQNANYFYNSVYIYGQNGGTGTANPSYNFLRIPNNAGNEAGASTTLRNNIFINERTGIGAHRGIGNINTSNPTTGWNASASNYNFVSTLTSSTATRWGTTDYTWANWLTNSGGDANSSYIPAAATTIANTQLNPTDLFETDFLFGNLRISLLNTDATNFIAQKGTPVSVVLDIDQNPRNPATPDVGAHEFSQLDADAGITEAINDFCEGLQDVQVTLNNFGDVNLTSATIQWSINGIGQTPFNWTGTLAPGSTDTVIIGSYNFLPAVDYTLEANTSNPNGGADADVSNDEYTSILFNASAIPASTGAILGISQPCAQVENQPYSIGTVAGATVYNWSLPSGWSIGSGVGTSSILINTGTAGQHGNIEVTAENACGVSAPQTLAVTLPAANDALSGNGDNRTCLVNKNGWIHFYDNDGDLIASVNSLGQNLGNVTATSYINASPYTTSACIDPTNPSFFQANLQRTFVIDAQNQPATPVKVRLYLLDAEVTAYQAAALATTQNTLDDIPNGLEDLNMTKVSNGSGTGNPTDFCGSGGAAEFLLQDASGNINLPTTGLSGFTATSFIEFTINGFSEFFPMNADNSALPVTLTNLSANCADDKIQVNWTTASELNASHFILQSSRDGLIWIEEAQIAATGTTNQTSTYSAQVQNFGSLTYYRLLQIDLNGDQEIFVPISSNCAIENNLMSVYPNPTSENFTVYIQTSENFENATIELVDMYGRIILSQNANINTGSTMLNFDGKELQAGTYMIHVKGQQDKFTPIRVVKM